MGFNPPPSRQQLEAVAKAVGVDADLEQMLPPAGVGMNLEPIRLCAACYVSRLVIGLSGSLR
ncbi:hypothetical protein [Anabaena sp. UHCC 0204]|uniref:hypothetical protein n=1 Tax=Anabaena sp. UHCC 0204 TaxID=2590009 RepID=UPI001447BD73|nr:hypothetical protein [Anabaena sp. UHCC 0204]MTJ08785.1 hypothetical protein [Anabaena sp. UHCC 0204]